MPCFCKTRLFADYLDYFRKRGGKEEYASTHVGVDTPELPGGSF